MTRFDLLTAVAVASAAVLSGAASLALVAGVAAPAATAPAVADPWATPVPSPAGAGDLVVDVEGAVMVPGVHRLVSGARVADAVAAAGGYADTADLAAAARSLNLAAPLADGQQVYVPFLGEVAGGSDDASGLVNLNTASQSALEDLPGIGPVTAERIIEARSERPFATLDELVARDVLTARQLEQIADLVTVR